MRSRHSLPGDAITLAEFDARFRADADPWGTTRKRDEAVKREAILQALGAGRRGVVWELASGNGSNSAALARRALRLVATDGSPRAVELTAKALDTHPNAVAQEGCLPDGLPEGGVDAVVVAEVLYYLTSAQIAQLGRKLASTLRPRSRVVLAHHLTDFSDTASRPADCHAKLWRALLQSGRNLDSARTLTRTRRWRVDRATVL